MGLRHRGDPRADRVRVCTLAVVRREGRRQFERRLRRFATPALERAAGRDLFRPPLAQSAHRRCASGRRGGVNLLTAPTARLDLSLVELVRGRFIPTRAILVSPTVTLDIDRPPFAAAAVGSGAPASVAGALAPLTSLSLSNGLLRIVGARRGLDTLIANVQGRLDGLTVGNQLRFNLSAEWRNAPMAIAGVLGDPEAAAKGASSRFEFALNSPIAKFAFDGAIALGEKPSAEGDMTASVPSIAALAALLNAARPSVLAADDIAISGKVKAAADALTLGDATMTSAEQTFEGAIEIADAGGRAAVSGTLAAESLALEPLLGPPQRLFDPSRRVEREAVRAHAAAGLRPRLAPLGRPPRRLWPKACRRGRVRSWSGTASSE